MVQDIYSFEHKTITGQPVKLDAWRGRVLVVVNLASRCGLTPQYAGLELFWREYQERGVTVLGFPANNFGGQEPGTEAEILDFCTTNYEVSFPMFAKLSVKGDDTNPLYRWLAEQAGQAPGWNFHKYLVSKDGKRVQSIAPTTSADDPAFRAAVDALLAEA